MSSLPKLSRYVPRLMSLSVPAALEKAAKFVRVEREGPQSEQAIADVERALGVRFPADYRAFLRDGGGMDIVGDDQYGFGRLSVFGIQNIAQMQALLEEEFSNSQQKLAPILLGGDEFNGGVYCAGSDGEIHFVHCRDESVEAAEAFETALKERLGEVIVVDPDAARPPRFVIATFADEATAKKAEGLVDDAYQGHLDYIVEKKLAGPKRAPVEEPSPPLAGLGTRLGFPWPSHSYFAWTQKKAGRDGADQLEVVRMGTSLLVFHRAPIQIAEEGLEKALRAAGATSTICSSPCHVFVNSKTRRGLEGLVSAFSAAMRKLGHGRAYESDEWKKDPYALVLASSTEGIFFGLDDRPATVRELFGVLLKLTDDPGAKDWEFSFKAHIERI